MADSSAEAAPAPPGTPHLHALVGILVVCVGVGLIAGVGSVMSAEQDRLLAYFVDQRREQLETAADDVGDALAEVVVDLDLAAQAVGAADRPADAEPMLRALLALGPRYRLGAVYDPTCTPLLVVEDPRWGTRDDRDWLTVVDDTAKDACRSAPKEVATSPPIDDDGGDAYRAFATPIGAARAGGSGALALLVDMEPVLAPFRTVTADRSTELLVLGPHGRPASVSTIRLTAPPDGSPAGTLAQVVGAMRGPTSGDLLLSAGQAAELGLPPDETLVVHVPIGRGAARWSAAAFLSTATLRGHETQLRLRVALLGAAGFGLLGIAAAYVVTMARRDAERRATLAHAAQVEHLRERAERILDHVPALVLALGPAGDVTAGNRALSHRFPTAVLGGSLADALPGTPPETLAQIAAWVDTARTAGDAESHVAVPLDLGGEAGTYTVHVAPIVPPSADVACLVVLDDLTPVRELQERLVRVEKLSTVGVLAAGIAHEVGTPLGVIRGRAELVASRLGSDHAQSASLQVIVEQIDRIVRIIRSLLDFSAARAVPETDADLNVAVHRAIELLSVEAERRRVGLTAELPDRPVTIRGDADRLQQVLVNVVMNALDASPPETAVRVRVLRSETGASIEVVDQGHGIAPENLARVFDPFFSTKRRGAGTGLGLSIVDHIMRDHDGTVELDSQVGQGTTVTLTFGRARPGGDP